MKKKYEYIEIVKSDNSEVVRRFDVTGRTEKYRDLLTRGVMNDFDDEKYHVKEVSSNTELPISRVIKA